VAHFMGMVTVTQVKWYMSMATDEQSYEYVWWRNGLTRGSPSCLLAVATRSYISARISRWMAARMSSLTSNFWLMPGVLT
jgi:hypothetical protein